MEDEKKEEKVVEKPVEKKSINPSIDAANEAAERMEKATAAAKIENDRKEQIATEIALGGRTSAGAEKREATQHEKDVTDATAFISDDEEE